MADTTPPSTPTNFAAKVISSTQIDLSWGASTGGVVFYRLERGDGMSARIDAPTTSYSNTGLTPSTAYSYRLWAFDDKNTASVPTLFVTATTPAAETPPQPEPPPTGDSSYYLGASFQGLSLATPASAGSRVWWQDITGTDAVYGSKFPRSTGPAPTSLWGGSLTQKDSIQILGNSLNTTALSIVSDNTVPAGVSNKALQLSFNEAYVETTQTQYLINVSSSAQGMFYTSFWAWLQADLPSRMGSGTYSDFMLCEFKTPDNAERFGLALNPRGQPKPMFYLYHDNTGSDWWFYLQTQLGEASVTTGNFGIGQTYKAPIPFGRWFRIEWAYNRKDSAGNGWMWMALTDPTSSDAKLKAGTQVFAAKGPFDYYDYRFNPGRKSTLGMNMAQPNQKITRLYNMVGYGPFTRSASSPYVTKYTDMLIYNKWPSTATAHPSDYL